MSAPRVEFLWWAGCPSHPQALAELQVELEAAGLDPGSVDQVEIETDGDAVAERFAGSPTIRVDGEDVVDPGDDPAALTCRVYRLRDGRISPVPDRADLRAALGEAKAARKGD